MEALFIKLLNMSITASYLVLAVVLLRLLLKKAPKAIFVAMWALVGLRLMVPFSLESIFSLIPSAEPVPEDIAYVPIPTVQTGVQFFNSAVNPVLQHSFAPAPGASVNPMQIALRVASIVWAVGVAVMLGYCAFSYLRIHRKVREAACLKGRIWLCDSISSPFILGLFRPKIYLPSNMNQQDMEYVLAHENAHLKRRDHLWKPLGFLLLAVYWFNPLMWLAYILLCRDIELACDEKVLKQMGSEAKKPYSEALLNCSVKPRMIAACPLAFGEVGVKKRIKGILNYKKPAFWILLVTLVLCIVLAVCLLTNPKSDSKVEPSEPGITTPAFQSGELREKYSQYFGLDASGGLDVYVWQMAKGSYSFGVLPHSEEKLDWMSPQLMNMPGATAYEMRQILSSYGLDESAVYIIPWQNPLSSYIGDLWMVDSNMTAEQRQAKYDAYIAEIKEMLFGVPIDGLLMDSPIYDKMVFDVDGDGQDESCVLSYGRTSGLFTFGFRAYDYNAGVEKYNNVFLTQWYDLSFVKGDDGVVRVKAVDQADPPQTHYFDIVIENGNVSLRENGETEITGLIQVYYKPYPLLFVDTSSENTNAYVLCGFAPGRMYSTEDYLYNGRKLSEYIREQDVAVSSNILDRNKTLSFCDVNGNRFETVTDGLRCTGRMIDETVEVQAELRQIPNQRSCYLGTYSGIPIFPESITYGNRSISVDLNTDGNLDAISWKFIPAEPELYGEHFHYTVTATIGTQAYTIESNSQLPCKEEDVQIFVADVDLDGNYELIIYSKGMSRFRTISIYQLCADSVNQLLYYIINPEP